MNWEKLKEELSQVKKVVITCHRSPDGDAIGSSLGLAHVLEQKGFEVQVVVPNNYPAFYHWMPGHSSVLDYEKDPNLVKKAISEGEFIFYLDFNHTSRLDMLEKEFKNITTPGMMIDHHPYPDDFCPFVFSETKASSTAQLIFEFAVNMNYWKSDNYNAAVCLYTGILTDTGGFRFPATSIRTHEIVSELMKSGVQPAEVYNLVFNNDSVHRLKLLGYALSEKMEHLKELNAVIFSLSDKELKRFHYNKGDTEGLVNYGLSIRNVKMSVIIVEFEGIVKLSFRSKGDFAVNDMVSSNFKGGGHKNAAGAVSDLSLIETIDKVKRIIKENEALLRQ